MKKFKFVFARLLKVKKLLESKVKRDLNALISFKNKLEEMNSQLENQKILAMNNLKNSKTIKGHEVALVVKILSGIESAVEYNNKDIENLNISIEKTRHELLDLMKERKILESLKEKKYADYLKESGRMIDREANDLYLLRRTHV